LEKYFFVAGCPAFLAKMLTGKTGWLNLSLKLARGEKGGDVGLGEPFLAV
jgi:hypothetical protein